MLRASAKQIPMLIFLLVVFLCVSYDQCVILLLLTYTASLLWLWYAHKYNQLSYKTFFKFKKQK